MDITGLPNDIFIIITSFLEPADCIRCRKVNRRFNYAFTDPDFCRTFVGQHYSRAREVRNADSRSDWSEVLSKVAARYHFLEAGKPRSIERLALASSLVLPAWSRRYGVSPWHRILHFEGKEVPFHYPDTLWTYDDSLLIYPSANQQRYLLRDFNSSITQAIAIHQLGKVIRRIRLQDRVLVIEWCEPEPYHQLNAENEWIHRHFATAYDILQDDAGNWSANLRNEWRIHFLGLPLNSSDRFFSTHNSIHYAIFTWQPNRSPYGEGDPIETIAIWDISSPSSYLPSNDPTGTLKANESEGPKLVRRFSFDELDFYGIRQRSTPTLRCLELDEGHLYVIEEDHRWMFGPHASHTLPRLHQVTSVGIPIYAGPRSLDECGADGDVDLSFCSRATAERRFGHAPCWRHEEFPYLTIAEAVDSAAGVRFCARQCFMLETMSVSVRPKLTMSAPNAEVFFQDDLWPQMLAKGKICGDERFLLGENGRNELVILHFDEHGTDQT